MTATRFQHAAQRRQVDGIRFHADGLVIVNDKAHPIAGTKREHVAHGLWHGDLAFDREFALLSSLLFAKILTYSKEKLVHASSGLTPTCLERFRSLRSTYCDIVT